MKSYRNSFQVEMELKREQPISFSCRVMENALHFIASKYVWKPMMDSKVSV